MLAAAPRNSIRIGVSVPISFFPTKDELPERTIVQRRIPQCSDQAAHSSTNCSGSKGLVM